MHHRAWEPAGHQCQAGTSTLSLHLPPPCRHGTLPRVCRRWWRLANSGQLLADLDISIVFASDGYGAFLLRVRRLCEWVLRRAAGHVQRLQLHLTAACWELHAAEEVCTAVVAILVGCGAAGLRHLRLRLEVPDTEFWLSSWVPALRSVQRLEVAAGPPVAARHSTRSEACLMAAAPMRSLTSLQHLALKGSPLVFRDDLQLPAALTSLCVSGFRARNYTPHEVALMHKASQAVEQLGPVSCRQSGMRVLYCPGLVAARCKQTPSPIVAAARAGAGCHSPAPPVHSGCRPCRLAPAVPPDWPGATGAQPWPRAGGVLAAAASLTEGALPE